jgi:hypothetical protein
VDESVMRARWLLWAADMTDLECEQAAEAGSAARERLIAQLDAVRHKAERGTAMSGKENQVSTTQQAEMNTTSQVFPVKTSAFVGGPATMSKVDRYNWTQRNEPGALMYVAKTSLRIDPTYQRALNEHRRKRIAQAFNWAAFGVLVVAQREDGTMYVIDGQHRLAAVLSRSDVVNVPVVVFPMVGVKDEAIDFLITNKDRKPMRGIESFRAMLVAGDKDAVAVNDLVHACGREIGKAKKSDVDCIITLLKLHRLDSVSLCRVWPLVDALCGEERPKDALVNGLWFLERKMVDATGVLAPISRTHSARKKLIECGHSMVTKSINEARAYHVRGGAGVFARGLLKAINSGRRHRYGLLGENTTE